MLLSVIMVTRNAGAVVDPALQSLAQQQGARFELIVVDGASSDDTLAAVRRFGHLEPRVLCEPDAGIYDAMNKGIALARGDALFFLNADDRLAQPQALADLAGALQRSQAALAFGDVVIQRPAGDHFRSHRRVNRRTLGYESLSHQAVLARRSVFEAIGGFDLRWRVCADLDWLLRASRLGLPWQHIPRLVCRCLAGGFSDQHFALQLAEVRQLRRAGRSAVEDFRQRAVAALHRRAALPGARLTP